MKTTDQFSRRFMSICAGVSAVLLSGAALMYSAKTTYAAESMEIPVLPKQKEMNLQMGTNENYIPISIVNGYAYWLIFNTTDGYKFRKMNIQSPKWEEKQ